MSIPSTAAPARWEATHASEKGASHLRAGKENQDCGWSGTCGDLVVVAVADGHGSARSERSDRGARFAVEVARDWLAAVWQEAGTPGLSGPALRERFRAKVDPLLVEKWRQRVRADAKRDLPDWVLYGTTLLVAAATSRGVLLAQLGDGDILTVDGAGRVSRPLPRDERLLANETTSLAGADPAREMRLAWLGPEALPALIVVSSDGYSNSFCDEKAFDQVGTDLLTMIRNEGLKAVEANLPTWLREASAEGSGDDVTVGLLYCANPPNGDPGPVSVPVAAAAVEVPAEPPPIPQAAKAPPRRPGGNTPVRDRPGTILPPGGPRQRRPPSRYALLILTGLAGLGMLSLFFWPGLPGAGSSAEEKPGASPVAVAPRRNEVPRPPRPTLKWSSSLGRVGKEHPARPVRWVALHQEADKDLQVAGEDEELRQQWSVDAHGKARRGPAGRARGPAAFSGATLVDARMSPWGTDPDCDCLDQVSAFAVAGDSRYRLLGLQGGGMSEMFSGRLANCELMPFEMRMVLHRLGSPVQAHTSTVQAVHYVDADRALSIDEDGEMREWQLTPCPGQGFHARFPQPGRILLKKQRHPPVCAVTSRSKDWLVVAVDKEEVWYTVAGEVKWSRVDVTSRQAPSGKVTCLALSPDARVLATGHEDGHVLLWQLNLPLWHKIRRQGRV